MIKIFLSPSSQYENLYAYGGTNEAVQCRKIAAACETALKRCGFSVKTGLNDSIYTRAAESNSWGADLHVCIHTTAANGKVSGTRLMATDLAGNGYKACKAIYNVLAPITPGTSENITANPGLYEIKHTKAPCAYIECEFHDVPATAKWIVENVKTIGEAIAKGICNFYGVKYVTETIVKPWYETATNYCIKNGIFKGDGNGNYNWNGQLTRAEAAQVIYNICTRLGVTFK